MKLQRDIFIVAVVCQLHAGITEADKSVDNETPETYDKNLIQVVDDSVISKFAIFLWNFQIVRMYRVSKFFFSGVIWGP